METFEVRLMPTFTSYKMLIYTWDENHSDLSLALRKFSLQQVTIAFSFMSSATGSKRRSMHWNISAYELPFGPVVQEKTPRWSGQWVFHLYPWKDKSNIKGQISWNKSNKVEIVWHHNKIPGMLRTTLEKHSGMPSVANVRKAITNEVEHHSGKECHHNNMPLNYRPRLVHGLIRPGEVPQSKRPKTFAFVSFEESIN